MNDVERLAVFMLNRYTETYLRHRDNLPAEYVDEIDNLGDQIMERAEALLLDAGVSKEDFDQFVKNIPKRA